ncbi:MAG TPA: PEGA domain-containing protein [Kofleriaceae bacterium]|nr:PEGA domain-containing protein [Kofleriaceae bacterium]
MRAHADEATGKITYDQAEALRKQGKWAEACPLYEASYKADPLLGVLLHLADCHEHVGMVASAWLEFTDAIDLAKSKKDSREASAKKHADTLAPKVSRLHLKAPATAVPGMMVTRDGKDITVLVGTDMPIDPGDHQIVVSAPGYKEWKTKITMASPGATVPLEIPALEKTPETPVVVEAPKVHEGMLVINANPEAEIFIDGESMGNGHYEGKIRSGGHTLRVTAQGMRSYQTEVVVSDDETRTIPVLLEKEVAPVIVAPPPLAVVEDLPGGEFGVNLYSGVKLRNENPLVSGIRADVAFRFGRRVNFGVYVEAGAIDAKATCGYDMPGPTPTTPYDYGLRTRMQTCSYVMPGLQLWFHILPKRQIDPYIGIAPGFRWGFTKWDEYYAGLMSASRDRVMMAIVAPVRAGVDYHPLKETKSLQIGGYVEASTQIIGEETDDAYDRDHGPKTVLWLLIGARGSVTF